MIFKVELDFTATQPKATELLAGIVLSKGKEPSRAPPSPCATSAHYPEEIQYPDNRGILPVKKKKKKN